MSRSDGRFPEIEDAISSVAEATDWTFADASSDADATLTESRWVESAVCVSDPAAASSSVDADETVLTISPTAASNSSASLRIWARRRTASSCSCSALASASLRAFSCARILNFSTASATSPISSLRPNPGRTVSKFPDARSFIATLRARMGRAIVTMDNSKEMTRTMVTTMPVATLARSTHCISCSAAA